VIGDDEALHLGPTLGDLFLRACRRNAPNAIALWDDREELTYAAFSERVDIFAAALRASGLKRGNALAQLSANKVDAVCTIAAAFLLGLRYTPLHPLASSADHAFILANAEIDALVVDEGRFSEVAASLSQALPEKAVVFSHGSAAFGISLRSGKASHITQCGADPGDIALIAYTGGTTGRPKGVVHRHRSLVTNVLLAMGEWEWRDPIRFLAVTPISHAAFLFVLPVLLRGGSFGMSAAFRPDTFVEIVHSRRVTSTFLVPTMIYALIDAPESVTAGMESLDTIIYGAAPASPHRMSEAIERFGSIFAQLYGQTEAPNAVTMLFKRDHTTDRLASCGVPLCANTVALLDSAGNPAAKGEVGEVCVRGPLVMDGYWKRPEDTAAALANGWLHTGDLAREDQDGYIFLVDRKSDLIITGGFNVYAREVEDAIAEHVAVAQCCVVGAPDPKWGEAVTAVIALRPGAATSAEEIQAFVRTAKGPTMSPKKVLFVDHLPLTSLGKLDRKAVRAQFWTDAERQIN